MVERSTEPQPSADCRHCPGSPPASRLHVLVLDHARSGVERVSDCPPWCPRGRGQLRYQCQTGVDGCRRGCGCTDRDADVQDRVRPISRLPLSSDGGPTPVTGLGGPPDQSGWPGASCCAQATPVKTGPSGASTRSLPSQPNLKTRRRGRAHSPQRRSHRRSATAGCPTTTLNDVGYCPLKRLSQNGRFTGP